MIVIVAEGATNPSSGEIAEYLSRLGHSVRLEILGLLQRGGKPTAADRLLGGRLGVAAVDALVQGTYGICLSARGGEIGHEPYARVAQSECKVRDHVLDLIARLE
jgi:6-phosphofructokinase